MNNAPVIVDENKTDAPESPHKTLIEAWVKQIKQAKSCDKIKKAFDRMKEDMRFARGLQWDGQKDLDDPRYVANLVQRHLRQRTAALYAKNPKAVAHRRRTLDFRVWGGDPQELMQAQQQFQMAQQMLQDPIMAGQARQILQEVMNLQQDYQEGMKRRKMLDKLAETLEIVWTHQTGEQQPPFKARMKHMVRRTLTTGVGYLKLGYHRFEDYRPEDVDRVTDMSEQLAALRALQAEMESGTEGYDATSAEVAEMEQLLQKVTSERESFIREGLDFDFPRSTSIIPDPECYQLDGFLGAGWVAQEYLLTTRQVREVYGVDLGDHYRAYDDNGNELAPDATHDTEDGQQQSSRTAVYEIWNKHQGQTYTICDGHPDYLVAPKTPDVYLERFWPFFVLAVNGLEDEEEIFPPSDVRLIRHQQKERNLMRQRLREHRDAARPGHIGAKGKLDDEDKIKLENREAHQLVELNIGEEDDIRKVLQPIPTNPIDPNQYEVNSTQEDVNMVVGTQEAVFGGMSGVTATETSIAESSRLSSIGSEVDELDDFLTAVAKAGSHLLLAEMSQERATEIAGVGAIWPQLSGAEIAKDLWLEVRAGSSGRPNKSAEIQNLERVMPYIMQIPGVKPQRVLEEVLSRLDDRLDPSDFYDAALPAMTAMNRQMAVSTGDPSTDPNQQGAEGGDKTAVAQGDSNLGPRPPAEERNMDPNRA